MNDLYDVWFSFGDAMNEMAIEKTGSEDEADWFQQLGEGDANFLMMRLFLFTYGNNGRFVDSVKYWDEHTDLLESAMRYFGLSKGAEMVRPALELAIATAGSEEDDMPPAIGEKYREINDDESVKAEYVMEKVIADPSRFSVDVGEYL